MGYEMEAFEVKQLKQWLEEFYDLVAEAHSYVMADDFESAKLVWEQLALKSPRIKLRLTLLAYQQLQQEKPRSSNSVMMIIGQRSWIWVC